MTASLTALVAKWREKADKAIAAKEARNDPHDNIGYEYQLNARMLWTCADELDAALAAASSVPQQCHAEINGEPCGLLKSNPIHHQSRFALMHTFQPAVPAAQKE